MKVEDPGHVYLLDSLDGQLVNRLVFVKRKGCKYPGNVGHHAGTTMQEVLRALIDRGLYVNGQITDPDTSYAINCMMMAVHHLEKRAARRHGRKPPASVRESVYGKTCQTCGHVGCGGEHEYPKET